MDNRNIVLLHGALGSKVQLKPLRHLLSNEFNVYYMNFEGHGDRPSNTRFSIELFSDNIHAFLHENNIQKTHFFGYSMGGYVALHFALKYPDLVNRIITLGTKFDWNRAAALREVKMLDPAKVEEKVPSFAQYLDTIHTAQSWKMVMQKTAQMMIDLGNGNKLNNEDLQCIKIPVMIGLGALDNMVTKEESAEASAQISNSILRIIPDCKHPIEKVNVDELANILSEYIRAEN